MPETPRFEWLAEQFKAQALSVGKATNSGQRKDLLKRVKVLIDEVDNLILEEYLLLNRAGIGLSLAATARTEPTDHAGTPNYAIPLNFLIHMDRLPNEISVRLRMGQNHVLCRNSESLLAGVSSNCRS